MTHFFISYNQADCVWAEWIAWQLEAAGYSTYLQAWDSRPAENFVLRMNEAIRNSERMVAVLSPDYLSSIYASPEWASAFAEDPKGEKGILLPVRVRECVLTGFLKQITYIDLVGRNEAEARNALLSGIQRERAKPLTPPEFPKTAERQIALHPFFPGPRSKRFPLKLLTALVVLLLLVLGGLYSFASLWWKPPRPCSKSVSGDSLYYEAEDAELWGGASQDSTHPGFSGSGFVSGYGAEPEAMTTFWVDVATAGYYQVDLCYSNATNSAKMLSIYVNDERIKQTRLSNVSRWNIWLYTTEFLSLKAGRNAISYRKTPADSGQVNLDFIGVLQKPEDSASPQPTISSSPQPSISSSPKPTTAPVETPSVAMAPSPSPRMDQIEPTQEEMKEALLGDIGKQGFQRKGPDEVQINYLVGAMTIKIETFVKLGCKPANYGVGYECTYSTKLSYAFHSNDRTDDGRRHIEAVKKILDGSHGGATTKKFARSSEGWLIVND